MADDDAMKNNAAANDERKLVETLSVFARRYHDTLTERYQHDRRESVARLAIDLARMEGSKPEANLARAARLLTDAGTALAEERERPEREAKAEIAGLANQIASSEFVPAASIYVLGKREGGKGSKPGTLKFVDGEDSFQWKPYTSEKGFRDLLMKHCGKVCDEALPTLNETLFAEPPQLEKARAFLAGKAYYFDKECADRLARVATANDANEFITFWRARSLMMLSKRIFDRARAIGLEIDTLRALAVTRGESCANRSQSAAVAKKAKARMHDKQTGRRAKSDGKKNH